MSDNTTLNTGTGGDVIATDDIAGVKVQRVKAQFGADGSATDVSATAPLPVENRSTVATPATAQWTSATAVDTALSLTTTGYGTVLLTLLRTGSISSGTVSFEAYDGVSWFEIVGVKSTLDGAGVATVVLSVLVDGTASAYVFAVEGYTQIRLRLSTVILGAGTLDVRFLASAGSRGPATTMVVTQSIGANLSMIGAVSQATALSLNAQVVGAVAHDGVDSGNPIKIGGVARQANPTAVAALDRTNAMFDDVGRQVVVTGHVRDLVSHQHTQIASSSAETTIVTATASEFHDLVMLVLTNQTATAVNVTIKDATAGTIRMIVALAASGGAVLPFSVPVPQIAAVNNNWTATLSSAAVTVNIFAQFVKNV